MRKHKLKTTIYAASVATLSMSLATASFAQSRQNQQGANALGNLIGMIANASAKSKAKKGWAQIAPEIQQCVNTMFSSKNVNVDQIIAAGMSPTAKDIAPVIELCQTVMTAQLKTDFSCNVPNSKGVQVPTTCVQSYAKAMNGKWAPVSRDDFLRAVGNDEQVNVGDFETTVAQNARLSQERQKEVEDRRLRRETTAVQNARLAEGRPTEDDERLLRRKKFLETPLGKNIEKYLASPAAENLSLYARARIWSVPAEEQAQFRKDWEGAGLAEFYKTKATKSCDDHFARTYSKRINGKDVKSRFADHFDSKNPLDFNNKPIGTTAIVYRMFTANPYGGYGEDLGFFTCNVLQSSNRVISVTAGMGIRNKTIYR